MQKRLDKIFKKIYYTDVHNNIQYAMNENILITFNDDTIHNTQQNTTHHILKDGRHVPHSTMQHGAAHTIEKLENIDKNMAISISKQKLLECLTMATKYNNELHNILAFEDNELCFKDAQDSNIEIYALIHSEHKAFKTYISYKMVKSIVSAIKDKNILLFCDDACYELCLITDTVKIYIKTRSK